VSTLQAVKYGLNDYLCCGVLFDQVFHVASD
jgi:hypothetical protein